MDKPLRTRASAANVVQRKAACSRGFRIHLHAHGKFLRAVNKNLRDTRQLRNLLRHHRIGVFVDGGQRQSSGPDRNEEDRRIGRIDLAEARRVRHFRRKTPLRNRQGRLNVERRRIDVAVEIELYGDGCPAKR